MLDHEENLGYTRIVLSTVFALMSLLALVLFGISPKLCGVGFIFAGITGFMGLYRISLFIMYEDHTERILNIILHILLNLICIPAVLVGLLLVFNLI